MLLMMKFVLSLALLKLLLYLEVDLLDPLNTFNVFSYLPIPFLSFPRAWCCNMTNTYC